MQLPLGDAALPLPVALLGLCWKARVQPKRLQPSFWYPCPSASLLLGMMVTLISGHHPRPKMENMNALKKTPWCSEKPGPGGLNQAPWETSLPDGYDGAWPPHQCLIACHFSSPQQLAALAVSHPLPQELGRHGVPATGFPGSLGQQKASPPNRHDFHGRLRNKNPKPSLQCNVGLS